MSSKKPMNSPIKWKKSGAQVSFYECLRLNSLELPSEVKGHVGRSVIAKDTTF